MEPNFTPLGVSYRNKYDAYVELIRGRLSEKRFFHSLCVAKEALRLAEKYGGDSERAFVAGLLHDICKDTPPKEQLQLLKQFGIMLDAVEQQAKKLWHARAGAVYLEQVLQLNDPELISAVRYHTTAKADMTLLEQILYLADFTSEDRDYPGIEEMRRVVDEGLAPAMRDALIFTVMDLTEKRFAVHEDTMRAYREYVKKQ